MKRSILLLSALLLISSCGKDNEQQKIGTIEHGEFLLGDSSLLKVSAGGAFHKYDFDVATDAHQNLIAQHDGRKVGTTSCLEYDQAFCLKRKYNFSYFDREVHFVGTLYIEEHPELLPINYFEQDHDGNNSLSYPYAVARYCKITVAQKTIHSLVFQDYNFSYDIREQNFIKKMKLKERSNNSVTISGMIPVSTSRNENIYTDTMRNGYRSSQNSVVSQTHYADSDTIFQGIEAKSEIDRFLDNDNRTVGLVIPDLMDLLNP